MKHGPGMTSDDHRLGGTAVIGRCPGKGAEFPHTSGYPNKSPAVESTVGLPASFLVEAS